MYKFCVALVIPFIIISTVKAQRGLPDFSVDALGPDRIRISWVNQYRDACIQLNVQRSYDSARNFTTVYSALSPELPENGFVDNIPPGARMYYHIFYVLTGGAYYFTPSQHAGSGNGYGFAELRADANQLITIIYRDEILRQLLYPDYLKFKDSIETYTRDSLFTLSQDQVLLKPFDPKSAWIPSMHVFTSGDGYVHIRLPDAKEKKYKITFYDSDGKKIFTINRVTEPELILDKTNFIHVGWFDFELYESGRRIETNKVLLQQDF